MKLWGITRFEFAYQVRRPWPWLFAITLLVVCFLMTRDAALADALYEDFFVNSPFAIATTSVFGGLIWLLLAAPIAGEAAARDVGTRMYPLVYTASVRKGEYLGGRFLAALMLNALILLAAPVGMLLAVYSPGVPPEVVGPFRPAAYLTAFAFLTLPNAVVATAIQFAIALRSGRAMASYVGSLLLVFMGFFVASLLLYKKGLGTLLDPIGIRFLVEDIAHAWTTIERNTRLLGLDGIVLRNRMVWLGIAAVTLAATYARFRFAHRVESTWWWRRRLPRAAVDVQVARVARDDDAARDAASVALSFGFPIQVRKTLAIAWTSFRTIATSWAGLALLTLIPLLSIAVVIDQMVSAGVPLVPTTARVVAELTGPLASELSRWVIIPLIIVFFAGELVWREREAGLAEITDAMPGTEWPPLIGNFLGLGLVLVAFTTLQTIAGMIAQSIMGYGTFEFELYLTILFGLQLSEYLLFALLAIAVHVVVNEKYIGHLVAIMTYVFIAVLADMLGIEHNLLLYGAGPGWSYSDMLGFGSSLGPWLWFRMYWVAWALLLAVVARLLWVRGKERGFGVRMQLARRRLTGATLRTGGLTVLLITSLGGFIFYNTNVLNEYLGSEDVAERRAEYERRYRRYAGVPQPEMTGTTLRVEFHPERRSAQVRGSYRLVNGSGVPIDSIHVATAGGFVETGAVTFDRPATLAVRDEDHGYRIYDLATPLEPGDTLRLDFAVHVERRGFSNRGYDRSLEDGGSSFTSGAWFPFVGYQRQRELISAAERREHGLEARPVIASLYEAEGREPAARGGGIAFDAVVGTSEDQVAVAPGALRRTWTEGGRRYFHYSTSAPIGNEWSFFSARYAVHESDWNGVAIRVYHHPKHTAHLDRVTRGVHASLDYLSKQFGPYPYRHLTVVEHPGRPATGLHADASMISHGEGFPSWHPRDSSGLDFPYAVVGHEMAHQWTVSYAPVEGAPFLSEGLAWYSAMQVVRASRGEGELRRLLSTMRQPYPFRPIRRGEPLLRALDPYLSYRRGPFAMFALSEYVGEDQVNSAIRRMIETHDVAGAPQATTLDLYRELKAVTPDSLKPLLHDLFEVNAYWQLDAVRASARQTSPDAWQVTLDVRARKMVYDSAGVEREVPMDEWVEIGIFAEAEQGDELSAPLYLKKHRVRSGTATITVTVPRKPQFAGIDPHHLLDWVEEGDDDNIDVVRIDTGSAPPRVVGSPSP